MHTIKSKHYPAIISIEWDRTKARELVAARMRPPHLLSEPWRMCDFFEFRRERDRAAANFVEHALAKLAQHSWLSCDEKIRYIYDLGEEWAERWSDEPDPPICDIAPGTVTFESPMFTTGDDDDQVYFATHIDVFKLLREGGY